MIHECYMMVIKAKVFIAAVQKKDIALVKKAIKDMINETNKMGRECMFLEYDIIEELNVDCYVDEISTMANIILKIIDYI